MAKYCRGAKYNIHNTMFGLTRFAALHGYPFSPCQKQYHILEYLEVSNARKNAQTLRYFFSCIIFLMEAFTASGFRTAIESVGDVTSYKSPNHVIPQKAEITDLEPLAR